MCSQRAKYSMFDVEKRHVKCWKMVTCDVTHLRKISWNKSLGEHHHPKKNISGFKRWYKVGPYTSCRWSYNLYKWPKINRTGLCGGGGGVNFAPHPQKVIWVSLGIFQPTKRVIITVGWLAKTTLTFILCSSLNTYKLQDTLRKLWKF